ncbi:MAG TPA: hypothetical protein VIK91_12175 [Nannocystis sp.]
MIGSPPRRILAAAFALAVAGVGSPVHAAPAARPAASATAGPAPESAPAAEGSATSSAPASAKPGADDPAAGVRTSDLYGDRLDGIEAEVNSLKDKIFRSKARLAVLRDTVMAGVAAGSRVVLAHRNLMGIGFRLVRIVYYLDGAQIFARSDDSGALDAQDEILIFDGILPPGPHEARIELTYQGQGYGVFTYLRGYTFKSPQTYSFTVGEGGSIKVVSKGYERGNLTTEMKDRPAVEFQVIGQDGAAAARPAASSAAAPASAPATR